MSNEENVNVRIQTELGEIEVYGPSTWVEEIVKEYVQTIRETDNVSD